MIDIKEELSGNTYPGRGIIIGKSDDGEKIVIGYFIMGRSENSRNRIFVAEGADLKTKAFDESKLQDPSLIIYAPVREIGEQQLSQTATRRILFVILFLRENPLRTL